MDDADRAQRIEQAERQSGIARARAGEDRGQQKVRDGVVYCLDCAEPIPTDRMAVEPLATRCITCKTRRERGRN